MPAKQPLWNGNALAAAEARKHLPGLVVEYYRYGRKLLARPSPKAFHKFRLLTKRLRYTLESFQPAYGPGLARRIASLKRIQDYLGEMNDCAVAESLLPNAASLTRFLALRSQGLESDFRQYWKTSFDRPGENRRFESYLARPMSNK